MNPAGASPGFQWAPVGIALDARGLETRLKIGIHGRHVLKGTLQVKCFLCFAHGWVHGSTLMTVSVRNALGRLFWFPDFQDGQMVPFHRVAQLSHVPLEKQVVLSRGRFFAVAPDSTILVCCSSCYDGCTSAWRSSLEFPYNPGACICMGEGPPAMGIARQAPCVPAGTSKRMGAFYEKTGVPWPTNANKYRVA